MKYNYIWFKDKYSRTFKVTVCYENGAYAFAIQNPKDMFVKKIGRELALRNFNNSNYYHAGGSKWIDIREHFLNTFFYDVINRYNSLPRFFYKAIYLSIFKLKLRIVEC